MTPTALSVTGLTKRYGERTAVDHLDIELPAGVVAGFVGPNGAGKTTTMAMLLGLVRPTSGTAMVLGYPIDQPAAYLTRVGALIESPAFYPRCRASRTSTCSQSSPGTTAIASRPCSGSSGSTAGAATATAATPSA